MFSSIPIDEVHEQNNACIKKDGGAVVLTDNLSALCRWMVAGQKLPGRSKNSRIITNTGDGKQQTHAIMIRRQVYRPHF